ncbi:MAG: SDR family NAD(P)-dependent oxidoreductase [Vicinamibacterales bacterium]
MKDRDSAEAIAIVGMGCRFHGATTLDELWGKLAGGVECISRLSDDEVIANGEPRSVLTDQHYVKACGYVDGIDQFDAPFFGLTPKEAEILDPQSRLFLECAWEALEDGCCVPDTFPGRIGVFAGNGTNHYYLAHLRTNAAVLRTVGMMAVHVNNDRDYLSTRVSYALNLKGPSLTVQTACSTSLVAVCLGSQSLLTFESDLALAGGVYLRLRKVGYNYEEGGIMSPDGHCRSFDAKAQGTIFSSGVGVVALKRLSDALANGDRVYATIRGFGLNNDGAAKVGFTAPSVAGQAEVIGDALAMSGLSPEAIGFVEAHGTATELGDPIEVAALTKAYRRHTSKSGYCAIGSIKTNVGHTNSAAGIAGLIKATLALDRGLIPPNLHFERPNPAIDFANSPFFVNAAPLPWPRSGHPRAAAVSSFGIGGTNAHVILEEGPSRVERRLPAAPRLVVLSARSDAALEAATDRLVAHLERDQSLHIADVAYSLQVGRKAFDRRRALVCADRTDAIEALRARDPRRVFSLVNEQTDCRIVFMLPGQGSQYVRMAADVYGHEPRFREELDRCAAILAPHLGRDLRTLLYPDGGLTNEEAAALLTRTAFTQPAVFAVSYALARLWMSWGVRPDAMVGHSIGEYVAACLAGVFSLEDALALVAERGRLMDALPEGSMLAVPLPEAQLKPLLDETVSLASVNAPDMCVASGTAEAIAALEQRLGARGLVSRRLHTSHAFHSEMMTPILKPFAAAVGRVARAAPQIPFLSNLTGTWITEEAAVDPKYWAAHLRGTVRFADNVAELLSDPSRLFIEVGPGHTLQTLVRQHPAAAGRTVVPSLPHPNDHTPDRMVMLTSLGELWMSGASVAWDELYSEGERPQRVFLPTYPFERQRYWVDAPWMQEARKGPAPDMKRSSDVGDWLYAPSWHQSSDAAVLAAEAAPVTSRPHLIFADDAGVSDALAETLGPSPGVVRVVPGGSFARLDTNTFTVNPGSVEDFDALLEAVLPGGAGPLHVIYAWPVRGDGTDDVAKSKEVCCYGLLHLAQALGHHGVTDAIGLDIVSTGLQDVIGTEPLTPAKALLIGLCRTIPQEMPNIDCRSVDIDRPGTPDARAGVVPLLVREFAHKSTAQFVAYRGNRRWTQSFDRIRLADPGVHLAYRQRGVYLITGGTGGIGQVLAGHLAQAAQARLALIGRSAFPDRADWDDWLAAHDGDDRVSTLIGTIREWEAAGAEVMVLSADVTSEAEMRRALDRVRHEWGDPHVVIHAAGIPAGGLIQLKTRAAVEEVLAPKLDGTLILDRLLAETDLDAFVMFSSIAAVVGTVGQVDYCAANAFIDAFAHARARRHGRTLAINWDVWRSVGMAEKAKEMWPGASAALFGGRNGRDGFEPLEHPFFEAYQRAGDVETYAARVSPATHWILDEHRLRGRATVVGTSYLEMARAAVMNGGRTSALELRDVMLFSPLAAGKTETRELRTTLTPSGSGYDFSVRSDTAPRGADTPWRDHAVGRVIPIDAGTPPRHDIAAIRARCPRVEGDADAERWFSSLPMRFGPRWRSLKQTVHFGMNEALVRVEVPERFADELVQLPLHPAVMDVALVHTASRMVSPDDEAFCLPFAYTRVVVKGSLPRVLYCHIRHLPDDAEDSPFYAFDAVITDEAGVEVVVIERFTLKKLSDSVFESLGQSQAAPAAAPAAVADAGHGIQPAEGIEVFKRVYAAAATAPQLVVSTLNYESRLARSRTSTQAQIQERLAAKKPAAVTKYKRPSLKTSYKEPTTEVERAIVDVWETVLGIGGIGVHDGFVELGGNSLLGVQIASRLREMFQVELPIDEFFKAPTVSALAEVVARRLLERVDAGMLDQLLDEIESPAPTPSPADALGAVRN